MRHQQGRRRQKANRGEAEARGRGRAVARQGMLVHPLFPREFVMGALVDEATPCS